MTKQRYVRNRYILPLTDELGRYDFKQSVHQQGRRFLERLLRWARRSGKRRILVPWLQRSCLTGFACSASG